MSKNRLHLDFSLTSGEDRTAFVNDFIQDPAFSKAPLTESELETIATYILWGTDASKQKDILLKTKWDKPNNDESYEALIESPNFSEQSLTELPAASRREVFSREEARRNPQLAACLEPLWDRIDRADLTICFYELSHNRRVKPPRESLLKKFSSQEQLALQDTASHLNQFQYLKLRHLLLEMRQEQYVIRDGFKESPHQLRAPLRANTYEAESPRVAPFGLIAAPELPFDVFQDFRAINASSFSEDEQKTLSTFLWQKQDSEIYFDFRNPTHLYKLLTAEGDDFADFLETFNFYAQNAHLNEIQREILRRKLQREKNSDIAAFVNVTFNKSYSDNYISTIYKQKILPQIAAAAREHFNILSNVFFKENFKKCNTCGGWFLLSEENFVRKSRSSDNFSGRCKFCDHEERKKRNQ